MKAHRATTKDLEIIRNNRDSAAAAIIGISANAVSRMRMRYNTKSQDSRHGPQKLYAEDIAQVMMLRTSGFSYREIGAMKGLHHEGIRRAIKRAEETGFDVYKKRPTTDASKSL